MKVSLYAHNQRAYQAASEMLARTGRAAIVHPTGTGKSFIGFRLVQDHPQQRTLWLSPSWYIFQTQLENLRADVPEFPQANLRFLTYARLMLLTPEEMDELAPDLIVLDEFHRCGAQQWGEGVQRLLACYPRAWVLGLSATAVRYLDNQRDMAEELFGGNIASEMTLGEAIVRGILPAPRYVTTVYRYQQDLERYQRRIEQTRSLGVRSAQQAYLEALRRALEKADGLEEVFGRYMTEKTGKYLVFCANVAHMRDMMAQASQWFDRVDPHPHCYAVSAEDPQAGATFGAFLQDDSAHLKLLYCVDMLNEGIHVPGISGVILFRPTVSPTVYKQQIGRALTAGRTQTPLILDVVNNVESLTSVAAVQDEMAEAVRFLCAQDRAEEIVTRRFEVLGELKDCRALFERLENSLSSAWEQYFHAASEYAAQFGDLLVPKRYVTPGGLSLGEWIGTQRKVRAGRQAGVLTPEQIARLDSLGMVWENRLETAWARGYAQAQTYYATHGDLLVPARYETADGFKLGKWVANLRQRRLDGRMQQVLTPQRVAQLEAIGMQWDARSIRWEENYQAAAQYFQKNGDLLVPANYKTPTGLALGSWVRALRRTRRGEGAGRALTPEQIARLDAIGMCWSNRRGKAPAGDRSENRKIQDL